MTLLRRLSEVIQLLSKSKCFSCYNVQLTAARKELISICPEFFLQYFDVKIKSRFCSACSSENRNNPETASNSSNEPETYNSQNSGELTWREIVDNRVKAKTRYFFVTPKRKTPLLIQDEYGSKLVPIIWASMANRIISKAGYFLDEGERKVRGAPNDLLLAQMFRVLGRIILGLGGPTCPHFGNIATQGKNYLN